MLYKYAVFKSFAVRFQGKTFALLSCHLVDSLYTTCSSKVKHNVMEFLFKYIKIIRYISLFLILRSPNVTKLQTTFFVLQISFVFSPKFVFEYLNQFFFCLAFALFLFFYLCFKHLKISFDFKYFLYFLVCHDNLAVSKVDKEAKTDTI